MYKKSFKGGVSVPFTMATPYKVTFQTAVLKIKFHGECKKVNLIGFVTNAIFL